MLLVYTLWATLQVLRVHHEDYLRLLHERCEKARDGKVHISMSHASTYSGGSGLEARGGGGDTWVAERSEVAASAGIAASLQAVDAVAEGKMANAFVAVRPPGHHAGIRGKPGGGFNTSGNGAGFCLVNYVAVAAKHLVEHWGFKRVTIVDIDAHHGEYTRGSQH